MKKQKKEHVATASDSIIASYTVSVASTTSSYDSLVAQLDVAVSGTAFTDYLTTYSAVYSTPGFDNCTSEIQSTVNTSSTGSSSSSAATLSMGAIIGIAAGGTALLCCCVVVAFFFVCKTDSSNERGAYADEVEMGTTTKTASAPPGENNSSCKMNRAPSSRSVGESSLT